MPLCSSVCKRASVSGKIIIGEVAASLLTLLLAAAFIAAPQVSFLCSFLASKEEEG
jgi:hypothetical protein